MKNKDFEFIKNKIDEAEITSSVDREFVMDSLKSKGGIIKLGSSRGIKTALTLVACVAVFAVVAIAGNNYFNQPGLDEQSAQSNESSFTAEGIQPFSSDKALKDKLKSLAADNNKSILFGYGAATDINAEIVKGDAAAMPDSMPEAISDNNSSTAVNYGETYKQIRAVDEADSIKTNGKYIFYSDYADALFIFNVKGKESRLVKRVELDTNYMYINDMFLYGDKLVANCEVSENNEEETAVRIYDVSDVKNVRLVKEFRQSGVYNTSRMIDGMLYVVSTKFIYERDDVPYVVFENEEKELSCDCIYYGPSLSEHNFLVISQIDVNKLESETQTKSILGFTGEVYCNEKNMYASCIYHDEKKNKNYTKIVKISLDKGIEFTASGMVEGYILNQYSFDERDGYLRLAVTKYDNKKEHDINTLYVLDDKLSQVGKVDDFAKAESIKTVRYIGDYAYVITYEQTDPLFIIDLKDPKNPTILGSCKIDGFSTMLVPIDDNTLLGIGYNTDAPTEYSDGMEVQNGIKLALFDISDKKSPRVLDEKVFKETYSDVQYNPRSLVYNAQRNDYVIPINHDDEKGGVLIFKVRDNKIVIEKEYYLKERLWHLSRCTFVDDYVYMITPECEIKAVKYN